MRVEPAVLATLRERLHGSGLAPRQGELMSAHTSYRIGGPADLFVVVHDAEGLSAAIQRAGELDVPFFVLGGGTNVLVGDRGFRGLVIQNRSMGLSVKAPEGRLPLGARLGLEDMLSVRVSAPSGAGLSPLARKLASEGLAGLSWAEGIPGTVGGAVVNNAGAFGSSMADTVAAVEWVDAAGETGMWDVDEMCFGYRTSRFRVEGGRFITRVHLALTRQDAAYLQEIGRGHLAQRKRTQPAGPSAGSVFKNPVDGLAGRLIEESGLKGRRAGGACISQKHANFIVNERNATAADVRSLIETIQADVQRQFGVMLELEIQLVGEF
jgi:UDP-N-acetylmuramate dehydrogenase